MSALVSDATAPRIRDYGDNAILIDWTVDGFDPKISDRIHSLATDLRKTNLFTEVMPGYDSLVVAFDLARISPTLAAKKIKKALSKPEDQKAASMGRVVDIPVTYGGSDGPDLSALAARIKMSPEDVIRRHSEREYRVCMMGFIPGFAFLSDIDPQLQHPRHATPRAKVPAGSVGIANWQTGIYGLESPGGWQIIGRTNSVMFDPARKAPFLVEAGDRIRFIPQ